MTIATALNFIGSLLPVVFPDKEFKPKRLAAVVFCFGLVVGSINLLGVEGTVEAVDLAEDLVELTQE